MAAIGTGVFKQGHKGSTYSLGLVSQLPGLGFPSGERGRGAQLNRDAPGMRGSTPNHIASKIRNNKTFILILYPIGRSKQNLVNCPENGPASITKTGIGELSFGFQASR